MLALLAGTGDVAADTYPVAPKQTVYVPIYSHIDHGNLDRRGKPDRLLLSAMLSIRNTDASQRIRVRSVAYHDSDGRMLREYQTETRILPPLAAIEFFVEHRDMAGGAGASFLVVWEADAPVSPPIIEAIHAHVFGSQTISFVSPGRVIRTESRP